MMLGTCSMEVPRPWATRPPHRFSRKLMTAKPHHLGAAARHGGAPGQAGQPQGGADGRAGDGQCQRHAHQHRDEHPHEEGLQIRGPHDELPHGSRGGANGRRQHIGQQRAGEDGHQGRDKNVHRGFLAHQFSQLRGDDGQHQHRQGAAPRRPGCWRRCPPPPGRTAPGAGLLRRSRLPTAMAGPAISLAKLANLLQQGHTQLGAQSGDDGANQQGGEQPLGHGAHGVHKVKPAVGFHRFPDAVPLLRGGGWGLFSMVQKNLPFSEERGRRKTAGRFLAVSSPWFFPCLSRGPAQGALLRESMLAMLPEKPVRFGPRNRLPGVSRRAGRFWGVTGGTACLGRFGYWNIIAQMGGGWKGKRGDFPRLQKRTPKQTPGCSSGNFPKRMVNAVGVAAAGRFR